MFLTARTSAMVCWLFVGSWTFSSVFSYLGGEGLIKDFVLSLNLNTGHVPAAVAADHLPARLAARVERDHHHLRADLPAAAAALQRRPDVLRRPGRAQPADLVPDAADGDVGLLPEGHRADVRAAVDDLQGLLPVPRHGVRDHVPGLRVPAAGAIGCRTCSTATERDWHETTISSTSPRSRAAEAARRARARARSAPRNWCAACLARIRADEPRVQAWAFLDREHALEQARNVDRVRREGHAIGPLHGLPVGIKDIIDTADMPTEDGTVLHAGRTPAHDATVVERLRAAGAIILGKTVTTELATYAPGKTRNPHNPEHTPGGSSSGSAAAVAARMVPVAIGTQTNGIGDPAGGVLRRVRLQADVRPGSAPRHPEAVAPARPGGRLRAHARGRRARRRAADRLRRARSGHPATGARCRSREAATRGAAAAADVRLRQDTDMGRARRADARGVRRGRAALGDRVVEIELPDSARQALDWHRTIMEADIARNFDRECEKGRDRLIASLRADRARTRGAAPSTTTRAATAFRRSTSAFDEIFERCDAILTPATPGTAPGGPRVHRQPGVLHAVDALRDARGHAAAAAGRERPADGRPAGRAARRRRAPAAHRALARGVGSKRADEHRGGRTWLSRSSQESWRQHS